MYLPSSILNTKFDSTRWVFCSKTQKKYGNTVVCVTGLSFPLPCAACIVFIFPTLRTIRYSRRRRHGSSPKMLSSSRFWGEIIRVSSRNTSSEKGLTLTLRWDKGLAFGKGIARLVQAPHNYMVYCLSKNSSDGHEFLLSRKAAEQSGTIRTMLSSGKFMESGKGRITFKDIKGKILEKVNSFANVCCSILVQTFSRI